MSEKSVADRLQVKGDRRLSVIDAPDGLDATVGAYQSRAEAADADVVLLFALDRATLDEVLAGVLQNISVTAIFWLAYPKLSSKLVSDLNRDIIRTMVPAYGLDTVSQIAIDDDWSALRLKRIF